MPLKDLSECPSDPSECPSDPSECPLSASLHASVGSVAFLWGARKATDSPMSIDLIVDHITEGDRTNYAVDNLQFLTLAENVRKWHRHRRGVGGANEQHE